MVITHCDFFIKHPPKAKADKKFISRGVEIRSSERCEKSGNELGKMRDLLINKYLDVQRGGVLFVLLNILESSPTMRSLLDSTHCRSELPRTP
jgi:hypothetical protein